jgi:hypothetical protein
MAQRAVVKRVDKRSEMVPRESRRVLRGQNRLAFDRDPQLVLSKVVDRRVNPNYVHRIAYRDKRRPSAETSRNLRHDFFDPIERMVVFAERARRQSEQKDIGEIARRCRQIVTVGNDDFSDT